MSSEAHSLTHYMQQIGRVPLLNREQELQLARAAQRGCKKSRDHMVLANLRLVVSVARKFQKRGLGLQDLISEGNTGLIHAIEKFDPEAGFRFTTYAVTWIKERMLRALVNQGTTIRVANAAHDEYVRINRAIDAHVRVHGRRPSDAQIAAATELPVQKVRSLLGVSATNVCSAEDIGGEDFDFMDIVAGHAEMEPEFQVERESDEQRLSQVMCFLTHREQQVIRMRFWEDMTLEEVGKAIGLTRERVRQLQLEAIRKMRRHVQAPPVPRSLLAAANG